MTSQNQNIQNAQQTLLQSHHLLKLMTNAVLTTMQFFGFDLQSNEKQHKIQFNSTLFSRPNQKAFDVIVHFLLSQSDPERAEKVFSQCWPIVLKEQHKEFKEVVFNWLTELSQRSNKQIQQHQQQQQHNSNYLNQFQHLIQLIRFPNITKSLLLTPGNLKICELLFALSQYVLLVRLIKLIESSKLNIRILPKISPFYSTANQADSSKQPFSQAQTINSNPSSQSTSAKLVSQKQLNQFEIELNMLKRKIDYDMNEYNQQLIKMISLRTKWQQYAQEKITSIRTLRDKKQNVSLSLARKKAMLAKQLKISGFENMDENALSLENIIFQFDQTKLPEFEKNWLEFMRLNNESLENEFNKENIGSIINNFDKNTNDNQKNKLELNGYDFIKGIKHSKTDQTNEQNQQDPELNVNDNILKFVYENIDRNASLINTEIGQLFHENGTKLDLISLIRLYNMVLSLNAEMLAKIDKQKLNYFVTMLDNLTLKDENEIISLDTDSSQKSQVCNILAGNKAINEDSLRIKKMLEAFLPKIREKYNYLLEKSILNENVPPSPSKSTISKASKQIMDNYFKLNKNTLDFKFLAELREGKNNIRQNEKFLNQNASMAQDTDYDNQSHFSSNPAKDNGENNSLEILDLEDSNMDLI